MANLDVDGISLHYDVRGSGSPAFLLFNGAGLRMSSWGELTDELSTLGTVIRFDQRGAGQTQARGTFSLASVAGDAVRLLDALHVVRAIAVGHAWGGRVAQVLARDFPQRLAGLVLCGTGGQLPPAFDPAWRERLRSAAANGDRAAFEESAAALYCARNFVERDPGRAQALFDELWESRFDGKGAAEAAAATPSSSYWGLATCGVQLIYGREDQFGTVQNALDLHRRLASSRLTFIENAGHMVIREKPDEVFRVISGFVAELEKGRSDDD